MGKVGKFIAGAGLVAASLFVPGGGFFATKLGGIVLNLSRVAGLSLVNSALARRPSLGRETTEGRFQGSGPDQPERFVFGEIEVPLAPVFLESHPTDQAKLLLIGSMCVGSRDGGGIEGVTLVRMDGKVQMTPEAPAELISGPKTLGIAGADYVDFANFLQYGLFLGADDQVADVEVVSTYDGWTSDHRGRGVAYIELEMEASTEEGKFTGGVPNIVVGVRGLRCFDPRDSMWKWTKNPVLHAREYLLHPQGYGFDEADLDDDLIIAAANVCDSDPGNGRGAPMFEGNGSFFQASTPEGKYENLTRILSSCRGYPTYQDGKIGIRISQADAPSGIKFTDEDLFGELEVVLPGSRRKPNFATVRYVDPDADHQAAEVRVPESLGAGNPYLTEDSDVESGLEIDLPMVTSREMAEDIGFISLKEARLSPVRWVTGERGLLCAIGDIVELSSTDLGWTDQKVRVAAIRTLTESNTVELTGFVHFDAAYDLDPNSVVPGTPGAPGLPDPDFVEPVTNVVQDCQAGIFLPAQAFQPRLKITWDASPHPWLDYYEVAYREVGTTPWLMRPRVFDETEAFVDQVEMDKEYESRVVAVNSFGVRSTAVVATSCTISEPTAAADPITDLEGSYNCSEGVVLTWTMPPPNRPLDHLVYGYTAEIREQSDDGTVQERWDNGTTVGTVAGFADFPMEFSFAGTKAQHKLSIRLSDDFGFVTDPLEIVVTNASWPCIEIVDRGPLVLNPPFDQGSPGEGSYWATGAPPTGTVGVADSVTPTVGTGVDLIGAESGDQIVLVQVPDDDDDISKTVAI